MHKILISIAMLSFLFVTCENSRHEHQEAHVSLEDTIVYAGTGEFLAHPYGVDTFFLDTIKSVKIGVDSIVFFTKYMEFDFKGVSNVSQLQTLEYHFPKNKLDIYEQSLSGEKFKYTSRFHVLKGDSIHFFIEETLGNMRFTTGILARRVER